MIGKLFKLGVAALAAYAAWQIGGAYWAHYQFEDRVQQIAQLEVDYDEENIRGQVVDEGVRLGLPVKSEDVAVRKQAEHLYIDVTDTRVIEIAPRVRKSWKFTTSGHGWFVPGGKIPPKR
jgi:hypothetical protein